ncbi:extracellular ribonuclease LE-like [Cornus florida]|uniref:extracellular ribonuclease LE-like n=1 Tax=Cornus florida TaxID=4283 RepID=UPI00289AF01C|nr:extracellular ribonuclease LE-like [Cornus florida]
MVQTWPKSFCQINNAKCVNAQNNFTLHGMWPAASNGQLVAIPPNTIFGDWTTIISEEFGRLSVVEGSNTTFWTYEWNKHGICSSSTLSASQYFQSAIAQKDKIDLLRVLQAYHIIPDNSRYRRSEIKNAVSQWIGGGAQAYVSCVFRQSTKTYLLYEIYIFVSIPIWHIISTTKLTQQVPVPHTTKYLVSQASINVGGT